jgi:hypothetical protein
MVVKLFVFFFKIASDREVSGHVFCASDINIACICNFSYGFWRSSDSVVLLEMFGQCGTFFFSFYCSTPTLHPRWSFLLNIVEIYKTLGKMW